MLNEGKIKQPREQTLQYYKILRCDDKYVLADTNENNEAAL